MGFIFLKRAIPSPISFNLRIANLFKQIFRVKAVDYGREQRSNGYVRKIMFERLWDRISATDIFSIFFCSGNCIDCLKRQKINDKKDGNSAIKTVDFNRNSD